MPTRARMAGSAPAQKVVASSLGAALAQILLWAIVEFTQVKAFPQGFEAAVTTVPAFVLGCVTPPASRDQIVMTRTEQGAP